MPKYYDAGNGLLIKEGTQRYYCLEVTKDNNLSCFPSLEAVNIDRRTCDTLYPGSNDSPYGIRDFVCYK